MKLSVKQKEVIQKMRDGIALHYMQGLNARCFFHNEFKNTSWATISKLEDLNLINRGDRFFTLTELGKSITL